MYRLATNNEPSRPRDESDEEESSVENSGSRIFFYSEVTKDSVLSLNRQLRDLSVKLMNFSNSYEIPVPPIRLHINSPGGSLLDAFADLAHALAFIGAANRFGKFKAQSRLNPLDGQQHVGQ